MIRKKALSVALIAILALVMLVALPAASAGSSSTSQPASAITVSPGDGASLSDSGMKIASGVSGGGNTGG